MWKKVLAGVSVPVAFVFSVSLLQMLLKMVSEEPAGTAGHRFGYILGQGVAAFGMGALLFLWWRWILRTFKRPASDDMT